jgi:hypothetical protein
VGARPDGVKGSGLTMSLFWSLPGPGAFIEKIASETRTGNSVLIRIPKYHSPFLSAAVRSAIRDDYNWNYLAVDPEVKPSDALFANCISELDPQSLRTVDNLVRDAEFGGRAIWVDGLTAQCVLPWCDFLLEYAHATRSLSPAKQSVLIVPVVAEAASVALPQEAGLSILDWNGAMDRLDISLHAALSVGDRIQGLEKQLTVAIAAELGGADPALVTLLTGLKLEQLLSPIDVLRDFAIERNWMVDPENREWWTGKNYQLENTLVHNTALLAIEGRSEEIRRLIWKAEVGTLFPVIEYYRQSYVEKYARLLVPFDSGFEKYEVPDLEIGMLRWQLNKCRGVDYNDLLIINDLKSARNALAHLRAVEPAIVLRLCEDAKSPLRTRG